MKCLAYAAGTKGSTPGRRPKVMGSNALVICEKKELSFQLVIFCLPWVRSLPCPSKNLFLFFDASPTKGSAIE